MQIRMQFACLLLVLLWGIRSHPSHAFSADLTRPWERPASSSDSIDKKQRDNIKGGTSAAASASSSVDSLDPASSKEQEQPDSSSQDGEEEDNAKTVRLRVTDLSKTKSLVHPTGTASLVSHNQSAGGLHNNATAVQESELSTSSANPLSISTATIASCLRDLWRMTRPVNDPGVVVFHVLGTFLGLQAIGLSSAKDLVSTLFDPRMVVVLLALLLTSSTSMLVNDYYDFKLGNDVQKAYHPLQDATVPLPVAKRFLSGLYAAALLCVALVPGVPARLAVVLGLMLTFWYTQHLKPRTWLKNMVCSSLIALAPGTSGVAALAIHPHQHATLNSILPLGRLVAMLFVGILGREITMDISDVSDDEVHGVRTVPVVYGRSFATRVSLACAVAVTGLAALGCTNLRQWIVALLGGGWQIGRALQVWRTQGQDPDILNRAVQDGLFSVLLLLASFV